MVFISELLLMLGAVNFTFGFLRNGRPSSGCQRCETGSVGRVGLAMLAMAALAVLIAPAVVGVTPAPGEFAACNTWFEQLFGPRDPQRDPPCLRIAHEDVTDGVTRGRSWRGTPLQLADKTYTHGIAFNSTKHIQVLLGRPARRFTAEVGLENNDDTQRGERLGQGSVRFHVWTGDRELYASPVMRRPDQPRSVAVDLKGAQHFEIRTTDGGDGRGWDQSLWAEAVVTLEDGATLRLQDLPWKEDLEQGQAFSFHFGGTNSVGLLETWEHQSRFSDLNQQRIHRELTWLDKASGLQVCANATRYLDFPAVEWVVHFRNTGEADTPILQDIQVLDRLLPLAAAGPVKLHWAKGAVASFSDFAPETANLQPGTKFKLHPGEGRSSSQVMPFFNLEGASGGIIALIGWSGTWTAEFSAGERGGVKLRTGLERTHLTLHPGESIRSPSMLLLFYEGDRWHGQNLLRQFLLKHHRPTRAGQPMVAPITCGNWGGTRAEVHLDNIDKIIQHDLPIEYYWIDAEWFGSGGWPTNVGDWRLKKDLYPNGFAPLSAKLKKTGRHLMLWFEPERVYRNTPWHKEHPEWLIDIGRDSLLLNLGNPEARRFVTDFISSKIAEFGLGCYRQDFNMDPLPYWHAADAPDRQGITEIRYIEGLYAFWDELRARHPDLILDNCASGGRRIDLETVGRATPFWRTDGPRDAIAHQCHTYGLMPWVPLSATSQDRAGDLYEFRSSMCSALCLNWWVSGDVPAEPIPAGFPFAWAKATLKEYLALRDFYYGDYYPLTSYSQAGDLWMAYQLDRPEQGDGMVVVLRRPGSPYESARLPLRALRSGANYRVTNLDSSEVTWGTGKDLSQTGLRIVTRNAPASAVFTYQRR
jgi:alpha-galactosidase